MCVVEVGGNSHHRSAHRPAECGFRPPLQFGKDVRSDLMRKDRPFADADRGDTTRTGDDLVGKSARHLGTFLGAPAEESLGAHDGVIGVCDGLFTGPDADQRARRLESDDRRKQVIAIGVGKDTRPPLVTETHQ